MPVQSHAVNRIAAVRALSLYHSIPNKIKAATLDEQCFTLWTAGVVIGVIRSATTSIRISKRQARLKTFLAIVFKGNCELRVEQYANFFYPGSNPG